MASLQVKTDGFGSRVLELKLGVNRLGRSATNDFQIEHPTISARHCEVLLRDGQVLVRDCNSTNGTFLDDQPIREQALCPGQILRLGEIELLVEATDVQVAIPRFELPMPAPPVVLADGAPVCPRHPQVRASYQCTHCREILCDACVHRLRRRGGKVYNFCPVCSHECKRLSGEKKKKKSFFEFLQMTVKLPFLRETVRTK